MKSTVLAFLFAAATAGSGPAIPPGAIRPIVLATTTSVRDTGLMDELMPIFAAETGLKVQLIAVGSGAALAMGEKGDADVLLTHDPDGEKALVEKGALVDHVVIAENFFLIAGPAEDPAGIAKSPDAVAAFKALAAKNAPYVSRGDDSGTHKREQSLMKKAGLDPAVGWAAVLRSGQGMGATLQIAGEKRAYALTDSGTFQSFQESTHLAPVYDARTPELRNVYAVSRPNPEKLPEGRVEVEAGKKLAAFLTSPATLERIGNFKVTNGQPLFRPVMPK